MEYICLSCGYTEKNKFNICKMCKGADVDKLTTDLVTKNPTSNKLKIVSAHLMLHGAGGNEEVRRALHLLTKEVKGFDDYTTILDYVSWMLLTFAFSAAGERERVGRYLSLFESAVARAASFGIITNTMMNQDDHLKDIALGGVSVTINNNKNGGR